MKKKSFSDRSAVDKRRETRPKHYKHGVFSRQTEAKKWQEGFFNTLASSRQFGEGGRAGDLIFDPRPHRLGFD